MLTRIRNGQARAKRSVSMPSSTQKVAIAQILEQEGYVEGYNVNQEGPKSTLTINLKYYEGRPVIEFLKRVSTPSLRQYKKKDQIPKIKDGLGTAIISTSKGLMTDKAARSQGVGGEVICIIA
jgi:small subunit ribosomal protein S8